MITQEQIEESEYLNKKVDYWSAKVNNSRFPTYPNGFVVESVRFSEEYQEVERQLNFWFRKLREFNSTLTSKQKKELNARFRRKRLLKN
ncbi:hypothetical protein [Pseudolactococcus laudensis]|uniref:hypothetical protein n=1 Tax=Pseudolactococcus laudensis TaxID=1494461 RepID=UPI002FCBEB7A